MSSNPSRSNSRSKNGDLESGLKFVDNDHDSKDIEARNRNHFYGFRAEPIYDQTERLANQVAELQEQQKRLFGPSGADFEPNIHRLRYINYGNPAPFGLSAFAFTTFLLSLFNVNAGHVKVSNMVTAPAAFYGGLAQLLASMWEMASGNTFGGAVFGSYGCFWLSYASIFIPWFNIQNSYDDPNDFNYAIGLYLICWFIFTFLVLLCTVRSTLAFFSLFMSLDVCFLLLACAFLRTSDGSPNVVLIRVGGAFGIFSACAAWYNAMAGLATIENSFFTVPRAIFPWSLEGLGPEEANRRRMMADDK
ncbi:plasma membrane acetate transmembrane transporter [Schizosaccharomyces pombe]|uniref:Meiotically up-regulated gene 86 protein n=1 Tax=Schizosaccharomyces pombe (strain 972 / ATCC 24843) TaxID=284812 RepID=MUG86_SCHPO|nr:putative acetate transmembrane transporter [Schizosaccharomyces pombe]O14201.1 RecName: Full=Meiotically up-regulated gene 86 protein [Schizosaccharomyces pombe 972h-]CAB10857.1 acetate transmembrane transporter (predicted) [Schizosaccharomyces pombe]|eukprot:NP_593360.1 putative acetate transmembrane transporter [Schizosaccharomyces pombe]